MSEWRDDQLGSVLEIKYGKDHKALEDGDIPCIGSGGIMRYVNDSLYDKVSILIPRKGSLNNIMYQDNPFWTVDTMFWSIINDEKVNPKFLFYQLTLIDYTNLNVGSAVPSLTVPVINEIDISLPEKDEQNQIAEILSSLDNKIDLLHRQNQTLEKMAETLFRQWFIEEADDSWEIDELGNYAEVVDNRGKTPPNTAEQTNFPLIEVNALGKNSRLVDYSVIKKYLDIETYNNWFRNKLNKYDTLISTVGSIGSLSMFIIEKGNIAQNIIGLTPINISAFYLYQYLKYKTKDILNLDIGGVQPSIKVPHLLSLEILVPQYQKQQEFDFYIMDYVKKMEINYNQIYILEKLRNTLLPKLMSGEVRIF